LRFVSGGGVALAALAADGDGAAFKAEVGTELAALRIITFSRYYNEIVPR
jgi:hypothetical protein